MRILDYVSQDDLVNCGININVGGAGVLSKGAVIEGPSLIKAPVGGVKSFGAFSYINGAGRFTNVSVGRYCSIAPDVKIGFPEHPTDWFATGAFQYLNPGWMANSCGSWPVRKHDHSAQTYIGNDVWIGVGAFIRGGVRIGNGAIIGAESVVTKDVPDYAIFAGNPARLVRYRIPKEFRQPLVEASWWDFSVRQLAGCPFDDVAKALKFIENLRNESIEAFHPSVLMEEDGAIILRKGNFHNSGS